MALPEMVSQRSVAGNSARLSLCGTYRYELTRTVQPQALPYQPLKPVLFIMLNPSTADAAVDDPTIRRCRYFAHRECGTLMTVVNLFALRATDPRELSRAADPVGPGNDDVLASMIERHRDGLIIAAWGPRRETKERARKVVAMLRNYAYCLGHTMDGSPRHPLMVPNDQPLERYTGGGL
jgi:hypothetical protein